MATQSPFSFLGDMFERMSAGPQLPQPPQWLLDKVQPPQWLVHEVQHRAVLFLNHVLMQESAATERLARQRGREAPCAATNPPCAVNAMWRWQATCNGWPTICAGMPKKTWRAFWAMCQRMCWPVWGGAWRRGCGSLWAAAPRRLHRGMHFPGLTARHGPGHESFFARLHHCLGGAALRAG